MKKYIKSAILSLSDEDPYALVGILQDEVTPEQLDELARHPSWVVRLSVIENPNVTREILQKLCRDSNRTVCNAAKYRLKEIGG
jgi:predicted hydrolase (HD superfamily)